MSNNPAHPAYSLQTGGQNLLNPELQAKAADVNNLKQIIEYYSGVSNGA